MIRIRTRALVRVSLFGLGKVIATVLFALGMVSPAAATHPCTSPLILDLDTHGVETTGVERLVEFDINGDGWPEEIGWTSPAGKEAFLWLDINHNNRVDDGSELFGTSTRLPTGAFAKNGFEALASYDEEALGGDGDGWITPTDLIWTSLRIWIDENHDAVSTGPEIRPIAATGILAISLAYDEVGILDGHGNLHAQRGVFLMRTRRFGRPFVREHVIDDVFFLFGDDY